MAAAASASPAASSHALLNVGLVSLVADFLAEDLRQLLVARRINSTFFDAVTAYSASAWTRIASDIVNLVPSGKKSQSLLLRIARVLVAHSSARAAPARTPADRLSRSAQRLSFAIANLAHCRISVASGGTVPFLMAFKGREQILREAARAGNASHLALLIERSGGNAGDLLESGAAAAAAAAPAGSGGVGGLDAVGGSLLVDAVWSRSVDTCDVILRHYSPAEMARHGSRALHYAASFNDDETEAVIRTIARSLPREVGVTQIDCGGYSILHAAVNAASPRAVEAILSLASTEPSLRDDVAAIANAPVQGKRSSQHTPLTLALTKKLEGPVLLASLLKFVPLIDVNAPSSLGETPLQVAVRVHCAPSEFSSTQPVAMLLAAGADVNAFGSGRHAFPPVVSACIVRSREALRLFLKSGAKTSFDPPIPSSVLYGCSVSSLAEYARTVLRWSDGVEVISAHLK
jgi:hypothetical protein